MKKHNEKLLDATEELRQTTLKRSDRLVYKLTHPSDKVSKRGSTIGKGISAAFIVAGVIVAISGNIWGIGIVAAGILTFVSNCSK